MSTQLKATTLPQMYRETASVYGDMPAFAGRNRQKEFEAHSFRELYEMAVELSTGLIELGVSRGDHVAIIADNRYEWILSDCAIQLAGAADVPRGTDVTDGDISYIIPHSDSVVVIIENDAVWQKIERNRDQLRGVKHFIIMESTSKAPAEVIRLYDLVEKGKQMRESGDRRVENCIEEVTPEDLFTIIYTSGTTGAPKGVMLTHANILSQLHHTPVEIYPGERLLSILPIWHIFERMIAMLAMYKGATTYYTSTRYLRDDMRNVRPQFMVSVPRLWEMIYQGVIKNVESSPTIKRVLFNLAYFFSRHFNAARRFVTFQEIDLTGRNPLVSVGRGCYSVGLMVCFFIPYLLLDRIVLSKIRAAMGGKIRMTISGGGALQPHIDAFFNNIGIPVLEGYGLTETSPVLAVRLLKFKVIGTVGPIWPHTEVRIVDVNQGGILYPGAGGKGKKGEIHVRGPQVMRGYYKNPEATAKVMRDGWLNTGDLGMVTYNNCLKLLGRTKETIVLLGGENVEPQPIESKILESEYVDQVMVVGQDKKYLAALIVPNLEKLKNFGESFEDLIKSPQASELIFADIKKLVNGESGFKVYERINDIRILPEKFEPGTAEMTSSFKLKRNVIAEKYAKLIESMY